MKGQPANPDATEIRKRFQALDDTAITQEASLAVRAHAWALLADRLVSDYLHGWNGAAARELAIAELAVAEALKIDPRLAVAHHASGFIHRARGRHQEAHSAFHRTTQSDPDFARAHAQKGSQLMYLGQPARTAALVDEAIRRSPNDPSLYIFYWIRGRAAFFLGDYDEAITWLQKSIDQRKTVWYSWLYLASAYALKGDIGTAQTKLREFDSLFPKYTVAKVSKNEKSNPNSHPVVVAGRQKFHEGLRRAGMPAR
jgi:adenylate cyclase